MFDYNKDVKRSISGLDDSFSNGPNKLRTAADYLSFTIPQKCLLSACVLFVCVRVCVCGVIHVNSDNIQLHEIKFVI